MKYKNMNILCQNSLDLLRNKLSPTDTVVCALGGGADSGVLVSVMKHLSQKIGFKLISFHVNHNLSPYSEDLLLSAKKQSEEQLVPIIHYNVNITRTKLGIESDARVARFKAINDFMTVVNGTHLALGHTATDAAETLFQRLMEGSGRGLGAMPAINGRIIRPLISMSREEIRELAETNYIHFMDDPMNFDKNLLRVLLREEVFPIIREKNHNIEKNMAKASQYAFEMSQFIEKKASELWYYEEKEFHATNFIDAENKDKILITTAIRQMIEKVTGETVRGGSLETEKIYNVFISGNNRKEFFIGKALIKVKKRKIFVYKKKN